MGIADLRQRASGLDLKWLAISASKYTAPFPPPSLSREVLPKSRLRNGQNTVSSLLMPLFLMGCFPADFQEAKRPLKTKSVKRPIKAGKRPINEAKRPSKAKVLVGVSAA